MQFQVPQFIETEDKIVGPLTLKQFLELTIAAGICFGLFFVLSTWLWFIVALIIISITLGFAFIKVNGRPLPEIAMAALYYYWHPRFYLWKSQTDQKTPSVSLPRPQKPFLENLWQQLITSKAPIPKREKVIQPSILDRNRSSKERFEMLRRITGERDVARRIDYR